MRILGRNTKLEAEQVGPGREQKKPSGMFPWSSLKTEWSTILIQTASISSPYTGGGCLWLGPAVCKWRKYLSSLCVLPSIEKRDYLYNAWREQITQFPQLLSATRTTHEETLEEAASHLCPCLKCGHTHWETCISIMQSDRSHAIHVLESILKLGKVWLVKIHQNEYPVVCRLVNVGNEYFIAMALVFVENWQKKVKNVDKYVDKVD